MSMIGVDPDETADYLDGKSEHAAANLLRDLGDKARNLDQLETALVQLINNDSTPPMVGHILTGLMVVARA
jgi:hypothetical protein